MTVSDLKHEIKKAIEEMPESDLPKVLDYLNKMRAPLELKKNLLKVLEEDKGLLERLAQ